MCKDRLHDTIVKNDCSSQGVVCCLKGTILAFDSLTKVAKRPEGYSELVG